MYSPPPPPQKKELPPEKKLTPRPPPEKIASTIMKKNPTPHLKNLNFSKNPNSIGKNFNSFEVSRLIKPAFPFEKILIPENLTPFRKLQSSHAHEKRN